MKEENQPQPNDQYVAASEHEAFIREQLLKPSLPPWPGYHQLELMHKYLSSLPAGDAIVRTSRGLVRMTIPYWIVDEQEKMAEAINYPLPPMPQTQGKRK